jgi:transcription antitermination protein NusB
MMSRRQTREYLLQLLYARACVHTAFDRDIFFDAYFEETDRTNLDTIYVTTLETIIVREERTLIDIIASLAPKFEVGTLPMLHILILMIAIAEILHYDTEEIPESVTINEAVELAKRFSDSQ